LTPEDISRATQLLTAHMGPIAPVLAKRAAQSGVTRDQFIASLASHLSDDTARSRFLEALG
jgi:eukaryotic-like serine/threonine-protein kinase